MFSEFPLSQVSRLVAYKTLGSVLEWAVCGRRRIGLPISIKSSPEYASASKGPTRGNNPREFNSRQVVASNQASASFVGGARSQDDRLEP